MQLNPSPKILVVNPYGIGDSLFITPLSRGLRMKWPNAHLALLLGSRTEIIFKHNPNINHTYTYRKDYLKSLPLWRSLHEKSLLFYKIRKQKFDVLIDVSNTDEYGFLAKFLWKIPIRIGLQYKKRGRFLTHAIHIRSGFTEKHVADYYTDLLSFLDIEPKSVSRKLDFYSTPKELEWLDTVFQSHRITSSDIVISILPGGGASWGNEAQYRYWPTSYYAKLADLLIQKWNAKIFLIGSQLEEKLCQQVQTQMKSSAISLAGQTTLPQLASLMDHSNLTIGTESGPLHLAAALDCKALVIYGPVDELVYGPYSDSLRQLKIFNPLPCRPCYRNFRVPPCQNRLCLLELTPEQIFEKAAQLLVYA